MGIRYQRRVFHLLLGASLFMVSHKGGSLLEVLDGMSKVGQTMGFSMDGCLKDMEIIICYITGLLSRWNREVLVTGDFNEVRFERERLGSVFNVHRANEFNSFISNAGIVEIQLEGYSFTWSHPSAAKMSGVYDEILLSDGVDRTNARYHNSPLFRDQMQKLDSKNLFSLLPKEVPSTGVSRCRLNFRFPSRLTADQISDLEKPVSSDEIRKAEFQFHCRSKQGDHLVLHSSFLVMDIAPFVGFRNLFEAWIYFTGIKIDSVSRFLIFFMRTMRYLLINLKKSQSSRESSFGVTVNFAYEAAASMVDDRKFRVGCGRFLSKIILLWFRFISAMNGFFPDSSSSLFDCMQTRFWEDLWLGEVPFNELFHLGCTALENNQQNVQFAVKMQGDIVSSFVAMSGEMDRWDWDLNGGGRLFVFKDARDLMDEVLLQSRDCCYEDGFRLFLIKEDTSHLFFSCDVALAISRLICRWWNVSWSPVDSYSGWLEWFNSIRLGSKLKGILEGVLEAITTLRCNESFSMERSELLGDSVLNCTHYGFGASVAEWAGVGSKQVFLGQVDPKHFLSSK
ncbi:RNA-directed DNA polymerase, eukaryota [Tanacetum coccineum]